MMPDSDQSSKYKALTTSHSFPWYPWVASIPPLCMCHIPCESNLLPLLLNSLRLDDSGMYHTQGEGGPAGDEAPNPVTDGDKSAAVELAKAEGAKPTDFNKYSKASVYAKPSLPFDIGFIRDSTIQTKNA